VNLDGKSDIEEGTAEKKRELINSAIQ